MRRSQAARYARWSALTASLLALATLSVYIERSWTAHVAQRNAPPPAASNVKQELSHGLTFSKQEGNRKIFTVEASKSTDFRDKDSTLLETVKITIFGKAGDRHDVLRTESCQYGKGSGSVECSGDVQMDLESEADYQRAATSGAAAPEAQVVHVETRGVIFDRGNGIASTDQLVHFAFPSGQGSAVGLTYNSEEGTLRLIRQVEFHLHRIPAALATDRRSRLNSDVSIRGSSLEFYRDSRQMLLHGPANASTSDASLEADQMHVVMDAQFRAESVRASKNGDRRPKLRLNTGSELVADEIAAHLTASGEVSAAAASGNVRGWRRTERSEETVAASTADLSFFPRSTNPRELIVEGSVALNTRETGGATRQLTTEKLRVRFDAVEDGQRGKIESAETLAPGKLEWVDVAGGGTPGSLVRTRLSADRLTLNFAAQGKASRLEAKGHVHTERAAPGFPVETAESQSGTVELAAGGWSQMDLDGRVLLEQDDRHASAAHAMFRRSEQTALLTGNVLVRDSNTETTAPRITFHRDSGEIDAEGGVHSADLSARGSSAHLAPGPANISAGTMQANSKTGRAVYSVRARLWQGASVLEAESIALERSARVLIASDNVRAVFPQGTLDSANSGLNPPATRRSQVLWHIAAQKLTYYDAENRAELERKVTAQTAAQKIGSDSMQLYFTSGSVTGGAKQISRAEASGNVVVEQGGRRAEAERGEYSAAEGKFVMSGGNPTIYDGSAGTTSGRKLTFFVADDTIIVDSQNGTRTVTKHRVER
jgi:lipopolysaccharide export system protein LptA